MAMTITDLSPLHEFYVDRQVVWRQQGQMILDGIVPRERTPTQQFRWLEGRKIGRRAVKVSETGQLPLMNEEFKDHTDICEWYGRAFQISEYAVPEYGLLIPVVDKLINAQADMLALAEEAARLEVLLGRTITADNIDPAAMTIDLSTNNRQWVGGSGDVSILDDIQDAVKTFKNSAKDIPDTLIVGLDVGSQLKKEPELRQYWQSADIASMLLKQNQLPGARVGAGAMSSFIGRLFNVDIYESNIHIATDPEDPDSDLEPLLENDAILMKAGSETASLMTYVAVTSRTVPEPKIRATWVGIWECMKPIIRQPWKVLLFNNVKA